MLALFLRLPSWLRILGPTLIFMGAVWFIHHQGYQAGEQHVQAKWDKAIDRQKTEIARLKDEVGKKETQFRTERQAHEDELAAANRRYSSAIAGLDSRYALRLQNSERRAGRYQHLSEGSAAERAALASHAGKLDASLEEGRRLVEELRTTLEQRDAQLKAVSQELISTRKLMGEVDGSVPVEAR